MIELLPVPYLKIKGRRFLIYQQPSDIQISKLIHIDSSTKKRHRPNIGVIVQVGDGYDPSAWTEEERDAWRSGVPYQVGDRVVWSKYDELVIRTRVSPQWWEDKTIKSVVSDVNGNPVEQEVPAIEAMRARKREETVEFVILKAHDIVGVLKTPAKEIWE